MKKWGSALLTGDIDHIRKAFSGNNEKRKITADIEKYIRKLYRDIYKEYGCHSNKYIRGKVEEKFEIPIGYECVRLILKDEKSCIRDCSINSDELFLPVLYSDAQKEFNIITNYFKKLQCNSTSENKGVCILRLYKTGECYKTPVCIYNDIMLQQNDIC